MLVFLVLAPGLSPPGVLSVGADAVAIKERAQPFTRIEWELPLQATQSDRDWPCECFAVARAEIKPRPYPWGPGLLMQPPDG